MKKYLRKLGVIGFLFLLFASVDAMQSGRGCKRNHSESQERSKRVFFVSECLLNQNIRAYGVRNIEGDGPVFDVLNILMQNGIGINSVPCPELGYEGLKRRACGKLQYLKDDEFRVACAKKAKELVGKLAMYLDDGYKIGGFVCVNGSPTCASDYCFLGCGRGKSQEPGIFIEEVKKELAARNLTLRFIGYDKWNMRSCLGQIQEIINAM